jgi:hypothetical protein
MVDLMSKLGSRYFRFNAIDIEEYRDTGDQVRSYAGDIGNRKCESLAPF